MEILDLASPSAVLTAPVPASASLRSLWCDGCQDFQIHHYHGDCYKCEGCGAILFYSINHAREGLGIPLAESDEAAKRFAAWCEELKAERITE